MIIYYFVEPSLVMIIGVVLGVVIFLFIIVAIVVAVYFRRTVRKVAEVNA